MATGWSTTKKLTLFYLSLSSCVVVATKKLWLLVSSWWTGSTCWERCLYCVWRQQQSTKIYRMYVPAIFPCPLYHSPRRRTMTPPPPSIPLPPTNSLQHWAAKEAPERNREFRHLESVGAVGGVYATNIELRCCSLIPRYIRWRNIICGYPLC